MTWLKKILLLLPLSCGIPDLRESLAPPETSPGASNASGGTMSFTMAADPAIEYLLRYKIYPFPNDSAVTDAVSEDVDFFENNSTSQASIFTNRNFYSLKLIDSNNDQDSEDFLPTAQGQQITITRKDGTGDNIGLFLNDENSERELARVVSRRDTADGYKSFYNEYLNSDRDVRGRTFSSGGGVAVFFIVQAVKRDPKNLLSRIYSFPQAIGYFLINDVFDNSDEV